jgi:hypothetical protein
MELIGYGLVALGLLILAIAFYLKSGNSSSKAKAEIK